MTDEKKTPTRKTTTKTATSKKTSTTATNTRKTTAASKTSSPKPAATRGKRSGATKTSQKTGASVVTIDGKDYPMDALNDNAKAQITNLRATDRRIEELEAELAITRTARGSYASALERELNELDSKTLQ